jgi:hypothetical protein
MAASSAVLSVVSALRGDERRKKVLILRGCGQDGTGYASWTRTWKVDEDVEVDEGARSPPHT